MQRKVLNINVEQAESLVSGKRAADSTGGLRVEDGRGSNRKRGSARPATTDPAMRGLEQLHTGVGV